ncbi:hypothetical protein PILCRDRAFT_624899 [Piloderma croceum F 1598]|uniref:Uncharacterized protein n=1 Tax=Piloderma croceum (strain F 1598) TaxID=765440 RepID=A0A0C3BIM4_PILCF|nr:hypothetical protein PILCRDRAFT_624899 [Piloderma croceum F 1598]
MRQHGIANLTAKSPFSAFPSSTDGRPHRPRGEKTTDTAAGFWGEKGIGNGTGNVKSPLDVQSYIHPAARWTCDQSHAYASRIAMISAGRCGRIYLLTQTTYRSSNLFAHYTVFESSFHHQRIVTAAHDNLSSASI